MGKNKINSKRENVYQLQKRTMYRKWLRKWILF